MSINEVMQGQAQSLATPSTTSTTHTVTVPQTFANALSKTSVGRTILSSPNVTVSPSSSSRTTQQSSTPRTSSVERVQNLMTYVKGQKQTGQSINQTDVKNILSGTYDVPDTWGVRGSMREASIIAPVSQRPATVQSARILSRDDSIQYVYGNETGDITPEIVSASRYWHPELAIRENPDGTADWVVPSGYTLEQAQNYGQYREAFERGGAGSRLASAFSPENVFGIPAMVNRWQGNEQLARDAEVRSFAGWDTISKTAEKDLLGATGQFTQRWFESPATQIGVAAVGGSLLGKAGTVAKAAGYGKEFGAVAGAVGVPMAVQMGQGLVETARTGDTGQLAGQGALLLSSVGMMAGAGITGAKAMEGAIQKGTLGWRPHRGDMGIKFPTSEDATKLVKIKQSGANDYIKITQSYPRFSRLSDVTAKNMAKKTTQTTLPKETVLSPEDYYESKPISHAEFDNRLNSIISRNTKDGNFRFYHGTSESNANNILQHGLEPIAGRTSYSEGFGRQQKFSSLSNDPRYAAFYPMEKETYVPSTKSSFVPSGQGRVVLEIKLGKQDFLNLAKQGWSEDRILAFAEYVAEANKGKIPHHNFGEIEWLGRISPDRISKTSFDTSTFTGQVSDLEMNPIMAKNVVERVPIKTTQNKLGVDFSVRSRSGDVPVKYGNMDSKLGEYVEHIDNVEAYRAGKVASRPSEILLNENLPAKVGKNQWMDDAYRSESLRVLEQELGRDPTVRELQEKIELGKQYMRNEFGTEYPSRRMVLEHEVEHMRGKTGKLGYYEEEQRVADILSYRYKPTVQKETFQTTLEGETIGDTKLFPATEVDMSGIEYQEPISPYSQQMSIRYKKAPVKPYKHFPDEITQRLQAIAKAEQQEWNIVKSGQQYKPVTPKVETGLAPNEFYSTTPSGRRSGFRSETWLTKDLAKASASGQVVKIKLTPRQMRNWRINEGISDYTIKENITPQQISTDLTPKKVAKTPQNWASMSKIYKSQDWGKQSSLYKTVRNLQNRYGIDINIRNLQVPPELKGEFNSIMRDYATIMKAENPNFSFVRQVYGQGGSKSPVQILDIARSKLPERVATLEQKWIDHLQIQNFDTLIGRRNSMIYSAGGLGLIPVQQYAFQWQRRD